MRKEGEIQLEICRYLKLRGYFFWRQNTTPVYDKSIGGFRKMPKFSQKGVADIILLKSGVMICLEIKSATGRPTEAQNEFSQKIWHNGGEYHIVRSVQDVMDLGL